MSTEEIDYGPNLLARDILRLQGVHPHLVAIVIAARARMPFIVVEGLRTAERQQQMVAEGKSQTMRSRHLTGHAVDLCPWKDRNGNRVVEQSEIDWSDIPSFRHVADEMKAAADALGYPIEWGGDWRSFYDGPHFQLPRAEYPA